MARPRTKNKDNARRSKKRVSILTQEKVSYVDYKDVNLLRRFQSDRAKIRARRVTQQRGAGRGRDGDRRGPRRDDREDEYTDDVDETTESAEATDEVTEDEEVEA